MIRSAQITDVDEPGKICSERFDGCKFTQAMALTGVMEVGEGNNQDWTYEQIWPVENSCRSTGRVSKQTTRTAAELRGQRGKKKEARNKKHRRERTGREGVEGREKMVCG